LGGEDGDHAGCLARLVDVDAGDPRVRQLAANDEGVQRAVGGGVVDVPAPAGEQRRVLPADNWLTDQVHVAVSPFVGTDC
jgi:hypothetical protein